MDEYKSVLESTFHFHPLAIEDAINDIHLPKIDDYGTYLYLVFHTVGLGQEPMDIETEEVDVFLGLNYLITIHDQPRRSIERAWDTEHHLAVGWRVARPCCSTNCWITRSTPTSRSLMLLRLNLSGSATISFCPMRMNVTFSIAC